jgi:hydrogenase expression/formation protein HypC
MCLGVPGKILSIEGDVAMVDFFGVQKQVLLHIVDEPVVVGDYILNHVGYAIRKIQAEDIEGTLAMYDELLSGKAEDLMRQDVESEIGRPTSGVSR